MRSNKEIKSDAKRKLGAYLFVPMLVSTIVIIINSIMAIFETNSILIVISFVVTSILNVFSSMLYLRIAKNDNFETVEFSWMNVSSEQMIKCLIFSAILSLGQLVISIFATKSALGLLSLIIMLVIGIYLSFSMLIILDTDEPILDAVKKSIALVEGNFWKIIFFELSFILVFILGSILIVGIIWVIPYFQISFANYYLELKRHKNL